MPTVMESIGSMTAFRGSTKESDTLSYRGIICAGFRARSSIKERQREVYFDEVSSLLDLLKIFYLTVYDEQGQLLGRTQTMICPYCGKEMEEGTMQSRYPLMWRKGLDRYQFPFFGMSINRCLQRLMNGIWMD